MHNLNMILDDYAKRGILDGNAVERLCAAHEREIESLKNIVRDIIEYFESMPILTDEEEYLYEAAKNAIN